MVIVEQLVTDAKAALGVIKDKPLEGGYMIELDTTMQAIGTTTPLDKVNFTENVKLCVNAIMQT